MGVSGGPNISENGLILALDASDRNSYVSGSTTWFDVSGNNNSGSLINGPGFSTDGNGSIRFDGVNDYVDLNQQVSASNWTVSHWFKFGISKTKATQYLYFNVPASGLTGQSLLEFTYSSVIEQIKEYSGSLYVAGRFTEYNDNYKPFIVKMNSSGSVDSTFNFGTDITQTQTVTGLYLDSTGSVFYTGYNLSNLVKKNGNTGATLQTIATINASITQANLVVDEPNNHAYIGGWFTSIQGRAAQRLARVFLNTMTIDNNFDTTTGFVNTEDVQQVVLQPDGKVIVGGQFTSYKSQTYNRIIRLDSSASIDTSFNVGTGFDGNISRNSIVLQSDGKIIVGGAFTNYSGSAINRIARLNVSGTLDTTFNVGTGCNGNVTGLATQSDGKIIAIGSFTTYSGSTSNYIVRINTDGTRDTTFNVGGGFNSTATALLVQSDGKILVAGNNFTAYSGSTANQLIRLNTNGTIDTTFNPGTGILGAYRLNIQYSYRNASNVLTTGYFYATTPTSSIREWKRYEVYQPAFENQWHNFTLTKDSGSNYNTYLDGIYREQANQSAALNTSLNIKTYSTPVSLFATSSIGSTMVYNRALSAAEILQNYIVQKSRFNL